MLPVYYSTPQLRIRRLVLYREQAYVTLTLSCRRDKCSPPMRSLCKRLSCNVCTASIFVTTPPLTAAPCSMQAECAGGHPAEDESHRNHHAFVTTVRAPASDTATSPVRRADLHWFRQGTTVSLAMRRDVV